MKFRDHAFATDHGQGNQHADGLGQGGAKCRACGTKLQHADEQIIQGNIKSTGNRNEKHRTFRVSYAAENGADDVVGCDKRDTEKTDGQVADGTADSFLRGGHDSHNGFYKTEQDCGQSNGQQHEQRCRVADGQVHLPAVLRAHCTSGHNRGAHSQPYDHDGKHVHDLTADRDSGGAVYRVKLSDDEQICGAVQGL